MSNLSNYKFLARSLNTSYEFANPVMNNIKDGNTRRVGAGRDPVKAINLGTHLQFLHVLFDLTYVSSYVYHILTALWIQQEVHSCVFAQ